MSETEAAQLTFAIAQIRHAYTHLKAGTVGDLSKFADGLIAPEIRRLESLLTGSPDPILLIAPSL